MNFHTLYQQVALENCLVLFFFQTANTSNSA